MINPNSEMDPALTSDEMMMMIAIDPKRKLRSQVDRSLLERTQQRIYLTEVESGSENPGGLADGGKPEQSGSTAAPVQGGFAFAALAPFLPIVGSVLGPLISKGIDWLTSKFSKKPAGQGVRAPNSTRGWGVRAPNGGAAIVDYFNKNAGRIQQMENDLRGMRGRDFWRNLSGFAREELKTVIPKIAEVGPGMAAKLAEAAIAKIIPASFQRGIQEPNKSIDGKGPSMRSIVAPIVKWAIPKVIDVGRLSSEDRTRMEELVNRRLERVHTKYPTGSGRVIRGGKLFERVRKIAKSVLSHVLPKLGDLAHGTVQLAIDKALDHFGLSPEGIQARTKGLLGSTFSAEDVIPQVFDPEEVHGVGINEDAAAGLIPGRDIAGPPTVRRGRRRIAAIVDSPSPAAILASAEASMRAPSSKSDGSRPAPGSQEMRDKMARLRAMRGSKTKSKSKKPVGKGSKSSSGASFQVRVL